MPGASGVDLTQVYGVGWEGEGGGAEGGKGMCV